MSGQATTILGLKVIFSLAAVVLILVYLVRPVWRSLGTRPEFLDSINKFEINANLEEEELQIPSEDEGPGTAEMIEMARSDPNKAAAMVSKWLRERK